MTHSRQQTLSDPIEMHRQYWSEGIDLDAVALLFRLQRARERLMVPGRDAFARHGLMPAEFDVLATLRRSPPPRQLTPSQVRSGLLITSGGLTKVMDKLEARGLVARSRQAADQRVRPVKLTASGKRLVERAMADIMAESTVLLRGALEANEIAQLTALLGKLAP